MRNLMLGLSAAVAAAALIPASAAAQAFLPDESGAVTTMRFHHGQVRFDSGQWAGDRRANRHGRFDHRRFDHRRFGRRGDGGPVLAPDLYGDEWALYNNRSWDSDSYNDWWHDRPDRAYPRWVQEQRGGPCDPSRMWWSGTGWHC